MTDVPFIGSNRLLCKRAPENVVMRSVVVRGIDGEVVYLHRFGPARCVPRNDPVYALLDNRLLGYVGSVVEWYDAAEQRVKT